MFGEQRALRYSACEAKWPSDISQYRLLGRGSVLDKLNKINAKPESLNSLLLEPLEMLKIIRRLKSVQTIDVYAHRPHIFRSFASAAGCQSPRMLLYK